MSKFYHQELAQRGAKDFMKSAVLNGITYDELVEVLKTQGEEFVNALLLSISATGMDEARKVVVTKQYESLKKKLKKSHDVKLVPVSRDTIQGRDWQADVRGGEFRRIYIAEDILNNSDLLAFERVSNALVPIFFTNTSAARASIRNRKNKAETATKQPDAKTESVKAETKELKKSAPEVEASPSEEPVTAVDDETIKEASDMIAQVVAAAINGDMAELDRLDKKADELIETASQKANKDEDQPKTEDSTKKQTIIRTSARPKVVRVNTDTQAKG